MSSGNRRQNVLIGVLYVFIAVLIAGVAVMGINSNRPAQEKPAGGQTTVLATANSTTTSPPTTAVTEQDQTTQTSASSTPIGFSGTGKGSTSEVALKTGLLTIHLTQSTDGKFIVNLINKSSGERTTLVDVIGEFDGTVATRVTEGTYSLAVQTEGDWKMTLQQPTYSQSDVEMLPVYTTGPDYAVLGPYQSDQPLRLTINATTDENVYVALLNRDGKHVSTLVDKKGPYHDSIEFSQKDAWLLEVRVEDGWALTVKPIE